jgi:hypothetical protein
MISLLKQTEMRFITKRDGKSRSLKECKKIAVLPLSKVKPAQEPKATNPDKLNKFAASPVGTIEEAIF